VAESIWLRGPEAKLERAIEHLEPLERNCERFLKSKPYAVTAEFEPEAGCYVLRFRARKSLPLSMSVRVGEIVHNLRSALDHVAWVLAASNTDDVGALWEPGTRERVMFPVAKTPEAFQSHRLMPLISQAAKAALDPLQPYTRGHPYQVARHPLSVLHDLWNIDKHRVVHAGIGAIDLSTTTWRRRAMLMEDFEAAMETEPVEGSGPLEDGAPIAYLRFPTLPSPPKTLQVEMGGQPTASVLFGAAEYAVSVAELEGLCAYVASVLTAVRPVFPSP
jgi:hypothetical protein